MSQRSYALRIAQGCCGGCGKPFPQTGDYRHCDACRTRMRTYYTNATTVSLMPDLSGPAILCCNRWHAIPTIPFRLGCCGRLLALRKEAP